MDAHLIMQANLLDMLFENRNKEYGAYVLRKDYNKRLTQSLLYMLAMVFVASVLMNFSGNNKLTILSMPPIIDVDHTLSKPPTKEVVQTHLATNHRTSMAEFPPIITKTDSIMKPDTRSLVVTGSLTGVETGLPDDVTPGPSGNGTSASGDSVAKVITPVAKVDRSKIVDHADISPQYPGGLKELIKFLKTNLHSPEESLEQEVAVKVKFVVNYDGSLLRFDVVESGGVIFDSEVLRVLKKMPKWIPGKSNGDNVAVWYSVPVKFLVSE